MYKDDHERAVTLLSAIIDDFDSFSLSSSQDKVSSLLFEEDKCNSYAEPVIVMEYIALAYHKISAGINLRNMFKALVSLDNDTPPPTKSLEFSDNLWQLKTDQLLDIFRKKILF